MHMDVAGKSMDDTLEERIFWLLAGVISPGGAFEIRLMV